MWSIDPRSLARVRSYADAENLFVTAHVSPQDREQRFVGSRYDYNKVMFKRGTSYVFRLYRTDVVTWHSPTHITLIPHASCSTTSFADCFLPAQLRTHMSDSYFCVRTNSISLPLTQAAELHFVDDQWQLTNQDKACKRYVKYVVDRKLAKPAVQKAKDYLTWAKMAKRNVPVRPRAPYHLKDAASVLLQDDAKLSDVWTHAGTDERIVHAAAVVAGAVSKVPLPFGTSKPKSVYELFV